MKTPKPVTIDFETLGIEGRPHYPPAPVGVSIKYPGKKAVYYAWGHPDGNNCDWSKAESELEKAWKHKDGLLFQNGKFDVDVANIHLGLPVPEWNRIHDTLFLLFLDDPHQIELGLKPSAERLLDWAPEEQDAVGEWLLEHQPAPGIRISKSRSSPHYFGRYIALAPGDLVGKYANGDVERTEAIFNLLWQKTVDRGMLDAYNRERKLMPILLEMERQGLPVDHKRLRQDVDMYNSWREKIDAWIIKTIKAPSDINLDSGQQLVDAMIEAKKVDTDLMPLTPTGKFQTNKEALLLGVTDRTLLAVLKYRTQLNTCLNTFMQPWLATADKSDGFIFTTWNQTKTPSGSSNVGTRTGRLSSTPNFQNIPKEFKPIFDHEAKGKKLPKCPFKGLPPLPKVRGYITSFDGEILCGRDFTSQELRVLAHFEGGEMMEGYIKEPTLDLHRYAANLITETVGVEITRDAAKTIAFSILYGSGLGKLSMGINCTVEDAKRLRDAYLNTFPGVRDIQKDLKQRSKDNIPIKTVGGREYYCESPKIIGGRLREFSYKMLNYLIQGSSADQTKDALIRFHSAKKHSRILVTVHDEILMSTPKKYRESEMEILAQCMNDAGLDVPMLSDGETGFNWAEMEPHV